ncbi:hypothetical protein [Polaromonas sp.]|uniref:hypothetical protein n=1 Tax=Polaromonas sp. TaxID=1869339 RepID=UPI00183E320C|nr:hypothetical protein [Polaromonas sp.]NML84110.1 hypothetical protein [Polaromonas sp.]
MNVSSSRFLNFPVAAGVLNYLAIAVGGGFAEAGEVATAGLAELAAGNAAGAAPTAAGVTAGLPGVAAEAGGAAGKAPDCGAG